MPSSWFEPLQARTIYQAEAHGESRAALAAAAAAACSRTAPALLAMQKPEGYWVGDLLADSTLESDYVLLQLWLYPPEDGAWKPPSWGRIQRAKKAILARQKPDGGFDIYPDGPADVNATIKAYVALKLAGLDVHGEPLRRARAAIVQLGGIQEANSYVRINLSLFGLYPKRHVPTIPVELALVPGGLIYEMSSWTRAIVMPVSIIQAKTDTRPVPAGFNLDELVVAGKSFKLPKRDRLSALFRQLDIALKMWATRGPEMIRKPAIREAEKWILDRTRNSDGLGAIYPSMMYLVMALDALGYPRDHPDLIEAIRQFEGLLTETPDAFYFQPCVSPVWDTSIAMFALGEMGAVAPAEMRRAADWFIAREIRRRG
ncbi:MAG: squalene--hopene cyclase, partial [Candidatus Rokuibacteriota bacterium]